MIQSIQDTQYIVVWFVLLENTVCGANSPPQVAIEAMATFSPANFLGRKPPTYVGAVWDIRQTVHVDF